VNHFSHNNFLSFLSTRLSILLKPTLADEKKNGRAGKLTSRIPLPLNCAA
jgi:hypothetical protein